MPSYIQFLNIAKLKKKRKFPNYNVPNNTNVICYSLKSTVSEKFTPLHTFNFRIIKQKTARILTGEQTQMPFYSPRHFNLNYAEKL